MYSISNIIVQVSINNFGVDTMAAWTAYSKIDFIFWMINSAFGISVMTFVGQNYGAGKWDRIRERYKNLSWHGTDIGGFCEYHLNVCREISVWNLCQ